MAGLATFERKDFEHSFELKALTAEGEIEGYGSVFGVLDSQDDIVMPGAFVGSLAAQAAAGRRPKMLWMHSPEHVPGVWTDVAEDASGLRVKGRLVMETQLGREAHALLKAGALDGLSIGFRTRRQEFDADTGVRRLLELELREVSIVSFPACEPATVTGVKGALRYRKLRQFETALRERLGFSRKEAEALAERGWKGLDARDEPSTDRDDDPLTPRDEAGGGLGALGQALAELRRSMPRR